MHCGIMQIRCRDHDPLMIDIHSTTLNTIFNMKTRPRYSMLKMQSEKGFPLCITSTTNLHINIYNIHQILRATLEQYVNPSLFHDVVIIKQTLLVHRIIILREQGMQLKEK